jgi:hypothetical protein
MLLAINYHHILNCCKTPYQAFFGIAAARFREQLIKLRRHSTFVNATPIQKAVMGK